MPVLTSPAKVVFAYPNAHYKVDSNQFRMTSCLRFLGALSGFSQILQKQNPSPNPENIGQNEGFSGEDSGRGDSQEIEGQTVERDMSAVANELRQELNQLRRTIYDLSKGFALLALAQLTCGAWIHWVTKAGPLSEISIQSFFAFAFPFAFAFLLRQVLKPMTFFTKMEEQGRLQILTLSLQVTKGVISLFQKLNAVIVLCAAGISAGLLAIAWRR